MPSSSSRNKAAPNGKPETPMSARQAISSKTRSNKPNLKTPRLVKMHSGGGGRLLPSFVVTDSNKDTTGSRSPTSPGFPSCSGALPFIPEIRIENTEAEDVRTDARGIVLPINNPQSSDYLRVPPKSESKSKPRPQPQPQQTPQPFELGVRRKKTIWDRVDRALGLHHVRTFGDDEPLIDRRVRAKRIVFRIIVLIGLVMMLSLATSIALFIYFGDKGHVGSEWFVWIAVSAVGWIWSFLAFIMAKRSKRQVLHDVEIARQRIRLNDRVQKGTAAPTAIIGGPSANRQQAMRASAASHAAAAVGSAPAVPGHQPGLEAIPEEERDFGDADWAQGIAQRLDMLVTENGS